MFGRVFMQLNAVSPQYWNYFKHNTAYPTALKKIVILMLKKKSQKYDH